MSDFIPRPLPTSGIFIAPFWADIDTGDDDLQLGSVRYGVTRDEMTLTRAQHQIRSVFGNEKSFTPSYLFVANWENVGYYTRGGVTNTSVRDSCS